MGNSVILWSLVTAVMASAACSTGSNSPATTGTGGTTGSGTGGTTASGSGGTTASGSGGTTAGTDGGGTGTGGTVATTDGGTAGPSVCDGAGTRILTVDQVFIDNFEEAALLTGWSSFNDVKAAPDSFKIAQQAGGAVSTAHSGHYAGTGATPPAMGGYGVGTVFNLAIDNTAKIYCVDISAFDGVTFWAKANQAATATNTNKITVNFVIPATNAVSVGGDCPDASMKCYNHPRSPVSLTMDWAQYSVTFAQATGGSAKVMNRIQELAFLGIDPDWDYSIDEIQFYKGTPPTTAVPMPTMP
ncbi:MAG TPA: hypothetical protein VGL59_22345 [Polyangia bacterium]|jgi:hypothetical protein